MSPPVPPSNGGQRDIAKNCPSLLAYAVPVPCLPQYQTWDNDLRGKMHPLTPPSHAWRLSCPSPTGAARTPRIAKDVYSLEKREARRAIPQAELTRRWEVADKAAAKQRKKVEKIQKKW
ncbi:hypothetical protein N7447_008972 [Penicillium robsamsonii]|uniref:uncharacterized protein n=1 Tax=Penicillium robsamsonii TaxID=1792511 RepID=UPI0025476DE1|nr:uncharacterized protein N7447_008972 [Penicillium robsamsonii]KAJ5816739.1 hypothetical protein N7447_008972 [Penicillium robsamsonii]